MKILIINTIQYNINGIANVILSHIKSLIGNNNEVTIDITSYGILDNYYSDFFRFHGIKIFNISNRRKFLSYVKQLSKIVVAKEYDIIHIHGNSGSMAIEAKIAKKFSKGKVVVHLHNSTCSHPIIFGPNGLLVQIMKKNADCLVSCSKAAGLWLFKENFYVLPNAIDLEKFKFNLSERLKIRSSFNILDSDFVIGHVGLFNEQKNQKFLVNIFAEYQKINPSSILLLVGTGDKFNEIQQLTKSLGINDRVIFVGNSNNMTAFYSAFDLLAFPSLWEGLPIVLIEAQANGLPIVASSAISEEVKFSNKVIFKKLKDNAQEWAIEIEKFRISFQDRDAPIQKMIEEGYDISNLGAKLLSLYNNLLKY